MNRALLAAFFLAACSSAPELANPSGSSSAPTKTASSNAASSKNPEFDARFTGKTLRFDYFHSGTATEEHVGLDRLRLEGPWPGSRTHLVDDALDLGVYRFRVVDPATSKTLFSRGFSSIYGEWASTGEAKKSFRTFHESQRFPEPKSEVKLVLEKRQPDGSFSEIHAETVDPQSRFVDRSPITPRGKVFAIQESGPPETKVDLLVLGDGYTAAEEPKFEKDAKRLVAILLATEPYKSHRSDFNVRGLSVPAAESGISNPRKGVWHDAPLGCSFNAFDTDRYVLTFANERLREAAAQAPYDALLIVFNDRKYGGGGIYNLWATCAADSEQAPYVFVHEFGHSFAALADEYYSSQVAYEDKNPQGHEPWEPNVTALLDPSKLKWADLMEKTTPLPTPWDQKGYDEIDLAYQAKRKKMIDEKASEEATEALMREVGQSTGPRLASEKFSGKVGAFEGAMYEAKGLYRPEIDCIMFTRNPKTFCRVCARAIERVIETYTR
jgi:hypothetical protein